MLLSWIPAKKGPFSEEDDQYTIFVNPAHILTINRTEKGSKIVMIEKAIVHVEETLEELDILIEDWRKVPHNEA